MHGLRFLATVFLLALAAALPAAAQDQSRQFSSPILTIDSERVFRSTNVGKQVSAEIEAKFADLAAENRAIEAELQQEELDLTERRAELPADEFRALADAFDEKVQRIRNEQDSKQREIQDLQETEQQGFLDRIAPILSQIGSRFGAVAVLERRTVLLSAEGIDITDEAIERINEAFPADDPADEAGNSE